MTEPTVPAVPAVPPEPTEPAAIALSLISHTNAGKTTLARTLLGRDVGEVRDAPHVTVEATPFPLVQTAEGDLLTLWDTPGFGDSVRLVRRLRQDGSPIGWFLSQVWDRYQDRAFWLTQLAVRNVAEQADVVLYLVNAAEEPADAGYLASELEVLEWVGKPVLVLLNQTGRPREREVEAADADRWRAALADSPHVRDVLALDAFARCWVQEFTLFAAIARALPESRCPGLRAAVAGLARSPHGPVRPGDDRARRTDRAGRVRPRHAAERADRDPPRRLGRPAERRPHAGAGRGGA